MQIIDFIKTYLKNRIKDKPRPFETGSFGAFLRGSVVNSRVAEERAKRASRSTRRTSIFEIGSTIEPEWPKRTGAPQELQPRPAHH